MKKLYWEILGSIIFVAFCTMLVYMRLSGVHLFWNTQVIWSIVLVVGWMVVAFGYYHQGWTIYKNKSSKNVSRTLPIAVFIVQCVLFVKGIFYSDWSLITGALLVNAGVVFNLYQIARSRNKN